MPTTTKVVVTGAAGGIGAETAVLLARRGAAVALFDRSDEQLRPLVEQLSAERLNVIAVAVDQTDRDAVVRGITYVAEEFGGLDGVFANAGYGQFSSFLETSVRNWQRHVDVNLTGTFHICQAAARYMASARTGGSIVINASSGASTYSDRLFAYCVTKAGLAMLVKGMASELGVHRIRVNGILPGVVRTPMTEASLAGSPHEAVLESETPLGRLGLPTDIAELVAFLISERSSFITGACVPIDGGQTLHGHPRWFRTDYRDAFEENWAVPVYAPASDLQDGSHQLG